MAAEGGWRLLRGAFLIYWENESSAGSSEMLGGVSAGKLALRNTSS